MGVLLKNELFKGYKGKKLQIFLGITLGIFLLGIFGVKYAGEMDSIGMDLGFMFVNQIIPVITTIIIPVFVSVLIGDAITDEYRNGTLKIFLLHPVSRLEMYLSKMAYVLIFNAVYLLSVATVFYFGTNIVLGTPFDMATYTEVVKICLWTLVPVMVLAFGVLILALSVRKTSTVVSLTVVLSMILSVMMQFMPKVAPYVFISHFDLAFATRLTFDSKLMVLAVWGIAFTAMSLELFRRKDILE